MRTKHLLAMVLALVGLTAAIAVAQESAKQKPAAPSKAPQDKSKLPEVSPANLAKIDAALPAAAAAAKKPHKLLVFWRCEGFFHTDGISQGNKFLERLGQKTGAFTVDISRDWEALDAANLAKYDGLVFNNTTGLDPTPERKQAILDFINGGKAIIGIHSATDNFPKWVDGQKLMGGRFAGHPWTSGGTWAFKLDDPTHPLCRAFNGKGFKLKDEIYQFKDAYTRSDRRVLITIDLSDETTAKAIGPDPKTGKPRGCRTDGDYAVSWIKNVGQGRLFYCSLGHNGSVFQDPGIAKFYLDGIQWALGDLEADASPKK
jgi:hypothetical protein